jgi:hypothetical protein
MDEPDAVQVLVYQIGLLKRIRDDGTGGTEVFWELTVC